MALPDPDFQPDLPAPAQGPVAREGHLQPGRLRVEIRILDDGRVVFGDLTPELAEVAAVLAGGPGGEASGEVERQNEPAVPEATR